MAGSTSDGAIPPLLNRRGRWHTPGGDRAGRPDQSRRAMIGCANWGSTSQGNRIQVSWLTSVT
jgi:hypothetical protein